MGFNLFLSRPLRLTKVGNDGLIAFRPDCSRRETLTPKPLAPTFARFMRVTTQDTHQQVLDAAAEGGPVAEKRTRSGRRGWSFCVTTAI